MRHQLPVWSPLTLDAVLAGVWMLFARRSAHRVSLATSVVSDGIQHFTGAVPRVLTDSGTSALCIALRAAADSSSGAIALPAYGCFDLATAVDGAGVNFLLYDVDPQTLGPDFASLERSLRLGARTIVAVHLYGYPTDMRRVRELANAYGANVIEDAAQFAFGSLDARPLGSWGDVSILSFGRGKGLTGGSGGAVLVPDSSSLAQLCTVELPLAPIAWRELAALLAQWLFGRPSLFGVVAAAPFLGIGDTRYRVPVAPSRISSFSIGVLSKTVLISEAERSIRQRNARRLCSNLDALRLSAPAVVPGGSPGFLRLPLLASGSSRSVTANDEARTLGIMPGYPMALCDLGGFGARRLNRDEDFSGARRLAEGLLTLPTHSRLSDLDLEKLERWLSRIQ